MVLSILDDVNVNGDDVDQNVNVHVWQVEHSLNHSISKKLCLNVRNAPLKMI